MTSKKALITGVTGMDGKLLSDLLISKGYMVYGLYRNNPNKVLNKIDGVEYIQATKQGTTRSVMIRKDSLRKVEKTTK